ncbi:MAG TPA: XRE family transcriptional regulator [Candidatus Acidoferrales bacterium]|nr:XRE family transcriptional regulator [Candidatus Acidoferrales bacterium]
MESKSGRRKGGSALPIFLFSSRRGVPGAVFAPGSWVSRKLSQTAPAARRLQVNQPKVSALSNYQLEGFSVERLMDFLTALDRDMDVVIRRRPGTRRGGRIVVTAV